MFFLIPAIPSIVSFIAGAVGVSATTYIAAKACKEASESFVDNVIRDKVHPKIGSIVYCDLAFGFAEHSGVYIGNNKIVNLNKHGQICVVTPEEFIEGTTAISIYVSCRDGKAVGSRKVAQRAKNLVGCHRNYNVLLDNCHQFSSGCLTGDPENSSNFLWMLKDTAKEELGANDWRVWDH